MDNNNNGLTMGEAFSVAFFFFSICLTAWVVYSYLNGAAHMAWLDGKQAGLTEAWTACKNIWVR
jgi:hypothetical protein